MNERYIVVRGVRISREDHPIASHKAIVCPGTTCYRGRRGDLGEWQHVVKFTWPSDKQQQRHEILGHHGSSRARPLGSMVLWNPAGRIREQRNLRRSRSSAARLTGLGISTSSTTISSSRQKRKRDKGFVDGKSGKRSRSIESRSDVANVEITRGTLKKASQAQPAITAFKKPSLTVLIRHANKNHVLCERNTIKAFTKVSCSVWIFSLHRHLG
ncbi:hypothetical protein B0J14DRAFT_566945 [Halenospora varia]|nr:hypothetical protein B0J14DRAFT_566945 [Halenospora varia]